VKKNSPEILLLNRQKKWKTPRPKLTRDLQSALAEVITAHEFPPSIREIEFLLVTQTESASVHKEFFNDATATDVMTFAADPMASIMICPEIARTQRQEEGLSIYDEVLTYAIHGLLHLSGMNDQTSLDFKQMKSEQARIRQRVLAGLVMD
jgi:probable rRNA maturation factor